MMLSEEAGGRGTYFVSRTFSLIHEKPLPHTDVFQVVGKLCLSFGEPLGEGKRTSCPFTKDFSESLGLIFIIRPKISQLIMKVL